MKISACIEWLFSDQSDSIAGRVYKAKEAGLQGVEFHLWRDKPIEEIKSAIDDTGLTLTSFCADPRRSIVDKSQKEEFLLAVKESVETATYLGCKNLIIASGFTLDNTSPEEHFDLAVDSLTAAASIAQEGGITLLLEPLNSKVDHPGMYLVSVTLGLDLVEAVNSPYLKLVYDAYHSAVMGDDICTVLGDRMHLVGHVQIADFPGRGAPGTGTIDWPSFMSMLESKNYSGMIALEYKLNDRSTKECLDLTKSALSI